MVASDNDSTNNNSITCVSSILTATSTKIINFLKLLTMCTYSYTLLKISWRLFDKHYTELTNEQKNEVINIYYDFY